MGRGGYGMLPPSRCVFTLLISVLRYPEEQVFRRSTSYYFAIFSEAMPHPLPASL